MKKETRETEQADPVEEEQPDDIESLHTENSRLQDELAKMVQAFEQYMRVASLQIKAQENQQ